jgi:dephospho-CoA kinase
MSRPTSELIGLSGRKTSGKDGAALRLEANHGYMHVSTSDMVRDEARRILGSVEDGVLSRVANEYRLQFGADVFCVNAINKFDRHSTDYRGLVVSGIRSHGEAARILQEGGLLVFIDAPIEVRFERYISRARHGDSIMTIDDFIAYEQQEELGKAGSHSQNTERVKSLAHIVINNSGTIDELNAQIDDIVGQ